MRIRKFTIIMRWIWRWIQRGVIDTIITFMLYTIHFYVSVCTKFQRINLTRNYLDLVTVTENITARCLSKMTKDYEQKTTHIYVQIHESSKFYGTAKLLRSSREAGFFGDDWIFLSRFILLFLVIHEPMKWHVFP